MTGEMKAFLLSLSTCSLIGPLPDVDDLTSKGYYKGKKYGETILPLIENINLEDKCYKPYEKSYQQLLDLYSIRDYQQYHDVLEELLQGSQLSEKLSMIIQYLKLMSDPIVQDGIPIMIESYPLTKALAESLYPYITLWPEKGLKAFELANALMMIRLGSNKGFLNAEQWDQYMIRIYDILIEEDLMDFKTFGKKSFIGREVFTIYMKVEKPHFDIESVEQAYAIAYFSIGQYNKHLNDKSI